MFGVVLWKVVSSFGVGLVLISMLVLFLWMKLV